MNAYVIWTGHRDYEENVAVCADWDTAAEYLAEQGVDLRRPYKTTKFMEFVDEKGTPWGVSEIPFLARAGRS
jgi:hypothetical protein